MAIYRSIYDLNVHCREKLNEKSINADKDMSDFRDTSIEVALYLYSDQ